ncbi:hypothetical protein [Microbacterium sp. CR_7]|uniref:hypothetical protein n=1 Tax=Microbacterium sp. CR_7 TaxID=3055792 RepID=UPI0035C14720
MADNNDAYLKVKIDQLDAEIKRLGKQASALRERKKGYQAQLSKQPSQPTE